MPSNLFGQDIKLDADWQACVSASGELILTEDGPETGVQDIMLKLYTYLGTLWYDTDEGSTILDWIKDENTEANRMAFVAEVRRTLRTDPRVVMGTEECTVESWNVEGIKVVTAWEFINEDHKYNLVIHVNAVTSKIKMVVGDVNPDSASL